MICNETYYGGFRTRIFADLYPTYEDFMDDFENGDFSVFYNDVVNSSIIYLLLYARYGNSHIAFSDENQFRANLFSTIWQYAPTWQRRVEVQKALRELSEEDLIRGGKAIYNHSFNPNTDPSTSTLEELLTINDQNTTNYKKSKLEGYSTLLALLETDVTEEFITKFKKLFITVVAADYPLLYETETEEN